MKIEFAPIGVIHSPFKEPENMPIQPTGADGARGTVEIFEPFRPGLDDLDGFSHIILLYHFHRSRFCKLKVVPFLDTEAHGVFATRAPARPNMIGLSIVALDKIEDGVLAIGDVDILDGTPLLDIKPYIPAFDARNQVRVGWLERSGRTPVGQRSDARFKE